MQLYNTMIYLQQSSNSMMHLFDLGVVSTPYCYYHSTGAASAHVCPIINWLIMKTPFPQHHLAFPYTPMAAIHIYLKKMKRKTCTHVVIGNHLTHPNKMTKKSLTPCQLVQNWHMFCVHSGTMCVGATTLRLNNLPKAHKNNITTPSS